MRIYFVVVVILSAFVLAACEDGALPAQMAQAPGVDIYSQGAQAQATLAWAQAQERATREAKESRALAATVEAGRATAAAQAAQAQATAQVEATSQALAVAAFQAESTATAQARITESALNHLATAQAIAYNATAQAGSLAATQAALSFEIQERALEIERARMSNTIRAVFGYAATAAILGVFLVLAYMRLRVVHLKRGPRGEAGVIIMGNRLLLPELAPEPVINIYQPPIVDSAMAATIKANSQKIEAVRAVPDPGPNVAGMAANIGPLSGLVEVIDASQVRPILDEVREKVLLLED